MRDMNTNSKATHFNWHCFSFECNISCHLGAILCSEIEYMTDLIVEIK